MPPALSARDVGISFGGLRALNGVNLDVEPAEIVGLIGPNGAGKTTLLDCFSGFLPAEGRVELAGVDVTDKAPHERAAAGMGRSFQDARLFPTMTVVDVLKVACELHVNRPGPVRTIIGGGGARTGEATAAELAAGMLERLGLRAFRDKLVRELSTGTRRIVDLGCVLLARPAVVLLDEPSSGIAQREAEALGPLLRDIRDEFGCAMVVVEHDMPLLLGIADRLYALETGVVVASGTPDDVIHHPEVVRSYLGDDLAAINRSGIAG